jgi:hypothetical protein
MAKNLLTLHLNVSNAPTKTAETVEQKIKRGRTRTVTVEKGLLKRSEHLPYVDPSPVPPALKQPRKHKKKRSFHERKREQQEIAKINRTLKAREKLRKLGPRVRASHLEENMEEREARERARQENLKDKVAEIAAGLLAASLAEFPNLPKAKEQLTWLGELRTDRWSDRDRRRVTFAQQVLQAFIAGRMPTTIEKPDGGYFPWPSTNVGIERGSTHMDTPAEEVGVLSSIGYRVGDKGVSLSERRALLIRIYERELHLRLSAQYLSEWGMPKTAQRLQKLANTIASLTRNMKRRAAESSAIEAWESDLEFLKHAYYVGRYSFVWPRYG